MARSESPTPTDAGASGRRTPALMSTSAPPDAEPLRRLQDERIRLTLLQNRRMRWAHTSANLATAWMAHQAGAEWAAWSLGLATVLLAHGRAALLQWLHDSGRRAALWRALTWSPAVVSLAQAGLLIAVFQQPFSLWQVLVTMVMFGNAAGGVAPAAGHLPGYLAWCTPIAGALIGCWLLARGPGILGVALLIVVLFALLIQAVAEQARLQREMVNLGLALSRAKEGAERASEAKTRFFAAASHDLRQPLAALTYQIATVAGPGQRAPGRAPGADGRRPAAQPAGQPQPARQPAGGLAT